MKKKKSHNSLIRFLRRKKNFTVDEILTFLRQMNPDATENAASLRLHRLVKSGEIQRLRRGLYIISDKSNFRPSPDQLQKEISERINSQFPYIKYCSWRLSSIREFHQHLPVTEYLIVEVEEEAMDAVFHFLKDSRDNIYKAPSKEIVEDIIIGAGEPVIIIPLISQSPLIRIDGVTMPTLEKILVDLLAEKDLFYFLQGNELQHILRNATDKYAVNMDKMLRYAGRRNKREELHELLRQVGYGMPDK